MSHTPGPWLWKSPLEKNEMPVLLGAGAERVCDFGSDTRYYPGEGYPPKREDAALIAAAPDLLVALEELVGQSTDSDDIGAWRSLCAAKERARAALAKARGQ